MMQNVVCFTFKWNIQEMVCEIKTAANAISQAAGAVFVFEHTRFAHGVLLNIWIIITAMEDYNTCDFMYKFS